MSVALDAMVRAMVAEFRSQLPERAKYDEYIGPLNSAGTGPGHDDSAIWTISGDFDLEKVTRAVLVAIREPTRDMNTAGAAVKGEASVNGFCDIARPYPELAEAVFTAMIDKILEGG